MWWGMPEFNPLLGKLCSHVRLPGALVELTYYNITYNIFAHCLLPTIYGRHYVCANKSTIRSFIARQCSLCVRAQMAHFCHHVTRLRRVWLTIQVLIMSLGNWWMASFWLFHVHPHFDSCSTFLLFTVCSESFQKFQVGIFSSFRRHVGTYLVFVLGLCFHITSVSTRFLP